MPGIAVLMRTTGRQSVGPYRVRADGNRLVGAGPVDTPGTRHSPLSQNWERGRG